MINPFIFGISGYTLTEQEIIIFKSKPCVGFILFARNIHSKEQVIKLTNSLKVLYPDRFVPIFIDQEGGRVARIKPPIAKKLFPTAKYFADIYENDPVLAKKELEVNYNELMSELKTLGIDSPCAPVCDLYIKDAHSIIGDRSFGSDPNSVIDLCSIAIESINKVGGIPFIKHIPGHGRADVDSHHALPHVHNPKKELEETDFKVFKNIAEKFKTEEVWAMTAHIIYSEIDPDLPATISKKVINYIKNEINFIGKLVTDDINMYALHGEIGKMRSVLKQTIKLALNNQDWQEKFQSIFKELFDVNIKDFNNEQIIDICVQLLKNTNKNFHSSLINITKLCLEAGCDIVLHCSGDINEIKAIYSAI